MEYKNTIIIVSDGMGRKSFPAAFSNEIYRSRTSHFGPMAYESCFSIKYSIDGESNYIVNQASHWVKQGSILIVNDGSSVECSTQDYEEGLSVFLDKELLKEVYQTLSRANEDLTDDPTSRPHQSLYFYDQVLLREANSKLRHHLDLLIQKHNVDPGMTLALEFYYHLGELLITTQTDIKLKVEAISKARLSTRNEIFSRVQKVKEFLDDTVSGNFDLDALSREAALSKFHLIRCYKEVYKTTPQKYFISRKIEVAKELLKKHGVTEVAQILNYRDIHSFSRQFKVTTGLPPSRYSK